MSSIQEFPQVTLTDVFNQFSIGINSSVVVTPNRRLAMVLRREFNSYQVTQGHIAWSTPDILPITAFIERAYEEMLYSEQADKLPNVLSTAQEQTLWEDVISDSDQIPILFSVSVHEAAKLAREAWQIIHEWQLTSKLRNFPLNDDCKVFRDWSKSYKSLTRRENQIDKARICDLIIELWKHTRIKKPDRLICHGFDIFTPQQRAFLNRLSEDGCEVMMTRLQSQLRLRIGNVQRISCADNSDEIHRAAVWARARIEADSTVRIGVVVQEFTKYRSEIIRIFNSVMEPDVLQALPGFPRRIFPFNVSLGIPLVSYPLVSTAFLVLGLAGKDIEFEFVSSILRSPFLVGGQTEMANRALLDEQLRKRAEPRITLEHLLILIKGIHRDINCPIFLQQISALAEYRKENLFGMQAPSVLARAISDVLQIFDFPGERTLDSSEYQTLKKWHEIVAEFAALDRVVPRIGYIEGVSRLHRMAAETLFQPETPDVPIQILGVFEAVGMEFDHLWVMGLSDTEWPLRPRINSFLPIELQRSAKLPLGSAVESLELARRFTSEWKHSSDEVIFSYPKHGDERDDRELTPSPLIVNTIQGELNLPIYMNHRDLIHKARRLEYSEDNKAPALDQGAVANSVSGGTLVIKDHAACPFRAFALHRLGARGLKSPHTGLDTKERGRLVHGVLAQAWSQLKTKSVLDTISDDDLEMILSNAAKEEIASIQVDRLTKLSKRFIKIEHQRLVHLTLEWLHEEKKRSDFKVIAIEDKRSVELGGLVLTMRLDRVDKLNDEQLIIIDYKTGDSSVNTMRDERPDEPQLPLYLVASQPDATAVVFAQVKTGKMKFKALARDSNLLPGIKADPEWKQRVVSWSTDLTRIAVSFSEGDAKVNPKKHPDTCRTCDLQPFCRVYERIESTYAEPEDGA
jgi:ATP-dependent helicase/nuclease subunit B